MAPDAENYPEKHEIKRCSQAYGNSRQGHSLSSVICYLNTVPGNTGFIRRLQNININVT
ncbi:hypothetical protein [Photorhabdus antumapuensis]|uniref:hypothetical protein n=1 Tax=Photorhabdus antumapuensis TaxID=2862867 RepID=UPI001CED77B6|nr:hypothetical protein [Photorhabdus antumapuensis]MCA6222518.1 hypothetical protein [Photorhabdus antumapuensis]